MADSSTHNLPAHITVKMIKIHSTHIPLLLTFEFRFILFVAIFTPTWVYTHRNDIFVNAPTHAAYRFIPLLKELRATLFYVAELRWF